MRALWLRTKAQRCDVRRADALEMRGVRGEQHQGPARCRASRPTRGIARLAEGHHEPVIAGLLRHRPVIPAPNGLVLERCPANREEPVTGEVHDQVQVDGIHVGSWYCVIAVALQWLPGS